MNLNTKLALAAKSLDAYDLCEGVETLSDIANVSECNKKSFPAVNKMSRMLCEQHLLLLQEMKECSAN